MDFRKKIKDLCRKKNTTQRELAKKLGITAISLNKSLRGKYPQLQTLEKIAIALEVELSDFFTVPTNNEFYCPKCGAKFTLLE
jgi:transcriptional regulator with XRE-family HTH domain